jgi:hypothetical protein
MLSLDCGQITVEDFSVKMMVDTDGTPFIAEGPMKKEDFAFVKDGDSNRYVAEYQSKHFSLNEILGFFIIDSESECVLMERHEDDVFFCINYPLPPSLFSPTLSSSIISQKTIAIAWVSSFMFVSFICVAGLFKKQMEGREIQRVEGS